MTIALKDQAQFSGALAIGLDSLKLSSAAPAHPFAAYKSPSGLFPSLVADFASGIYGLAAVPDGAIPSKVFADLFTFTRASTATYFDANGVMQTSAVDTPRLDHDPATGAALGLLVEESRTNLLRYSEQFDNTVWAKYGAGTGAAPIVTSNAALAPDGSMTADEVIFDSGSGTSDSDQSLLRQSLSVTVGSDYSGQIWLRGSAGGEVLVLRHVGSAAYFELALTTEWKRLGRVETALVASTDFEIGIRQGVVGTINSSATVYLWGAQLEAGAFATSYIPTTSAAVTRAADVCYRTLGGERNVSAVTVVFDFESSPGVSASSTLAYSYLLGGVTGARWMYNNIADVGTYIYDGVASWTLIAATTPSTNYKMAISSDGDGISFSVGGAAVVTAPLTNLASNAIALDMGVHYSLASGQPNGHIKSLSYFPSRLSDADLEALAA